MRGDVDGRRPVTPAAFAKLALALDQQQMRTLPEMLASVLSMFYIGRIAKC